MKQTFAAKHFAAEHFASGHWVGVGVSAAVQKPERIDFQSFRLPLLSMRTPPLTFRIYREGTLWAQLASSTGSGSIILNVKPGDHPFIEVLDNDADLPAVAFPGRLLIHWQAVATAVSYRVEENVASVWTLRADVRDDGAGSYSWWSRWLEDATTHQFRVIAVDSAGNQGTPVSLTAFMVRHPDAPKVSYSFSAGTGKVTISQA